MYTSYYNAREPHTQPHKGLVSTMSVRGSLSVGVCVRDACATYVSSTCWFRSISIASRFRFLRV